MEIVLLIGIPASGKTTYCERHLSKTHLRISRDVLGTKHREQAFFETALRTQTSVVIDNTNVTRLERARFIGPAREAAFRVKGILFDPDWAGSIARNEARAGSEQVPRVAIGDKAKRLEVPALEEGFDELMRVRVDGVGGFVGENV